MSADTKEQIQFRTFWREKGELLVYKSFVLTYPEYSLLYDQITGSIPPETEVEVVSDDGPACLNGSSSAVNLCFAGNHMEGCDSQDKIISTMGEGSCQGGSQQALREMYDGSVQTENLSRQGQMKVCRCMPAADVVFSQGQHTAHELEHGIRSNEKSDLEILAQNSTCKCVDTVTVSATTPQQHNDHSGIAKVSATSQQNHDDHSRIATAQQICDDHGGIITVSDPTRQHYDHSAPSTDHCYSSGSPDLCGQARNYLSFPTNINDANGYHNSEDDINTEELMNLLKDVITDLRGQVYLHVRNKFSRWFNQHPNVAFDTTTLLYEDF